VKPRVLFVGRTRYASSLPGWLRRKWEAVGAELDYRVLASSAGGGAAPDRFELVRPLRPRALDGLGFYATLPFRIRTSVARFRPQAIVAENPHVAAAALVACALVRGERPKVIVEVHGDWRTATRLYGSQRRRLLSPVADAVAAAAVRRADAVRALSGFTASLAEHVRGRPVDASFPTYSDLAAFADRPPAPVPDVPSALFVGVLEPYKNVDGLASAWRRVAVELPDARLVLVGSGSRQPAVDSLVAEFPARVRHLPAVAPGELAGLMDETWVLALPSRYEGLGRVVIEAFARGRAVVASGQGGILDLVTDGVEGILVDPDDTESIADALVRVLSDRGLAERLGAAARERYSEWHSTPGEFASRLRALVDATIAR
jgi:glycosyltransferase involved in cell wall biosynthesis